MNKTIIFNGRFLSAPAAGVQRVAEELVRAVDRRVASEDAASTEWELYAPPDAKRHPALQAIRFKQGGVRTGIGWEQLDFPSQTKRRGFLINLCNVGPLSARNAVVMIHDAQVYTTPKSYSRGFRLFYRFLQPLLAKRYRKVLTVSEFSKRELVEHGVAPESKIVVVHNGVDHILSYEPDISVLDTLGLEPRSYVLSLANTQSHKNIRILIEAFKRPELSHLKLVLFGGAKAEALSQLGAGPLSDNTLLAGKVSDPALKALMMNALCLAFPSRTEGFGLPPLEAMLLGCPAVVAPCGALPEVCGDAALYADADSPAEWAAHILALHNNEALWTSLSEKGSVQAKKFSWDSAAEKLVAVMVSLQALWV